jgi:hypothetical protein
METTHAKLLKPAGLSQTRSIVKARIDNTPARIFMRTPMPQRGTTNNENTQEWVNHGRILYSINL